MNARNIAFAAVLAALVLVIASVVWKRASQVSRLLQPPKYETSQSQAPQAPQPTETQPAEPPQAEPPQTAQPIQPPPSEVASRPAAVNSQPAHAAQAASQPKPSDEQVQPGPAKALKALQAAFPDELVLDPTHHGVIALRNVHDLSDINGLARTDPTRPLYCVAFYLPPDPSNGKPIQSGSVALVSEDGVMYRYGTAVSVADLPQAIVAAAIGAGDTVSSPVSLTCQFADENLRPLAQPQLSYEIVSVTSDNNHRYVVVSPDGTVLINRQAGPSAGVGK